MPHVATNRNVSGLVLTQLLVLKQLTQNNQLSDANWTFQHLLAQNDHSTNTRAIQRKIHKGPSENIIHSPQANSARPRRGQRGRARTNWKSGARCRTAVTTSSFSCCKRQQQQATQTSFPKNPGGQGYKSQMCSGCIRINILGVTCRPPSTPAHTSVKMKGPGKPTKAGSLPWWPNICSKTKHWQHYLKFIHNRQLIWKLQSISKLPEAEACFAKLVSR